MGRLLQAKRFVRILTKSTLSTPAPLLRPSAWQHVIPGRLRHAIGSPHTLLMQAGHRPTPGRHQVCTCTFAGNIRLPQVTPHPIPAGALTTPG